MALLLWGNRVLECRFVVALWRRPQREPQGSTSVPIWLAHPSWICVDAPCGHGQIFFFFNVARFDLKRSEIGPDLVRYGPIRFDSVRYGTKYWLKKRKRKRLDQNTLFCRQALKETTLKSSKFSLYYLLLFLN